MSVVKKQAKTAKLQFIEDDYKYRLRLLREIISGENQAEFAARVGVPFKRWNTYERGYPIPRETAWLLLEQFEGITVEWLWFGWTTHLSPQFQKRIKEVESGHREMEAATRSVEQAQAKLDAVATRFKKVPAPKRRKAPSDDDRPARGSRGS